MNAPIPDGRCAIQADVTGALVRRRTYLQQFTLDGRANDALPGAQDDPTGASLARIAAGTQRSYLENDADDVASSGSSLVIGFARESNGTWHWPGCPHTSPAVSLAGVRLVYRSSNGRNAA